MPRTPGGAVSAVPTQLIGDGPAPRWKGDTPPTCKVCGKPYSRHTGKVCLICRDPIEHHDAERVRVEIEAAARLAGAREAAGLPIREWESWCIGEVF